MTNLNFGSLGISPTPTFLKLDSWSQEAGLIPKKFNAFFKRWVKFCVAAIPRLP